MKTCGKNLMNTDIVYKGTPFLQRKIKCVKQIRDFIIPLGKFHITITIFKEVGVY